MDITVPYIIVPIRSQTDLQISGAKIRPASNITLRIKMAFRILIRCFLKIIKALSHARESLIVKATLITIRITIIVGDLFSTFIPSPSIRLSKIRLLSSSLIIPNLNIFWPKTMKV